jgi:hypothetical protein
MFGESRNISQSCGCPENGFSSIVSSIIHRKRMDEQHVLIHHHDIFDVVLFCADHRWRTTGWIRCRGLNRRIEVDRRTSCFACCRIWWTSTSCFVDHSCTCTHSYNVNRWLIRRYFLVLNQFNLEKKKNIQVYEQERAREKTRTCASCHLIETVALSGIIAHVEIVIESFFQQTRT